MIFYVFNGFQKIFLKRFLYLSLNVCLRLVWRIGGGLNPLNLSMSLPFPSLFFHSVIPLEHRISWIQLGGLGECCKLPQRGLGRSCSRN